MHHQGRLAGKAALITGGARGMGAAFARRFIAEGAKVLITDILHEEGSHLAQQLGKSSAFVPLDVSREEEWRGVVAQGEELFGPFSILVNNAAIIVPGNNEGPIEDIELTTFRRTIDINETGTFLGIKHIIPSMRRANGGSIINMSSVGGLVGRAYLMAYCTSKWAVVGITKVAAVELGKYNIRVNSVHPGAIWTPIHVAGQDAEQAKKTRQDIEGAVAGIPIAKIAEPEEVANMVLYLASDEASYSTGAQFVVDGGFASM